METPEACIHSIITGYVQGVGFRGHVQDRATRLGLSGWARNKGEDQVEVWAEGTPATLEKFLSYLAQGPSMARVDKMNTERPEPTGKYKNFSILASTW